MEVTNALRQAFITRNNRLQSRRGIVVSTRSNGGSYLERLLGNLRTICDVEVLLHQSVGGKNQDADFELTRVSTANEGSLRGSVQISMSLLCASSYGLARCFYSMHTFCFLHVLGACAVFVCAILRSVSFVGLLSRL